MAPVEPAAFPHLLDERPDRIVVLRGEGEVRPAQLRRSQAAHQPLDAVGDGAIGAIHRHCLRRVFEQLIGHRAQRVGVIPVHPVTQADRLLGLLGSLAQHARLALQHERREAIGFDVVLGFEALLLLHLDFHP